MTVGITTGASSATTSDNAMQAYGGTASAPAGASNTQSFDGTSWTSEGAGSYATTSAGQGCGDSTDPRDDFYSFGGYDGGDPADRQFASNFSGGSWTNLSPLPSNRTGVGCMYVDSTEIYAWNGHDGASYSQTGIVYDGVSFSTATGTTAIGHYGGVGGANVAP